MTDFPSNTPLPLHICSGSRYGDPYANPNVNGNPTSGTWGGANNAFYVPIRLPWPYPVRRMFWGNGSAAGGNWSIGIYYPDGGKLYSSGSIAGSGNSQLQYHTPTIGEFLLTPGRYYLALQHDSTTSNRILYSGMTGSGAGGPGSIHGILMQAVGSMPLPAAAVYALYVPSVSLPYPFCGFTRTASGF